MAVPGSYWLLVDHDQTVLAGSSGAQAVLERTRRPNGLSTFSSVLAIRDRSREQDLHAQAIHKGREQYRLEVQCLQSEGKWIRAILDAELVYTGEGALLGVMKRIYPIGPRQSRTSLTSRTLLRLVQGAFDELVAAPLENACAVSKSDAPSEAPDVAGVLEDVATLSSCLRPVPLDHAALYEPVERIVAAFTSSSGRKVELRLPAVAQPCSGMTALVLYRVVRRILPMLPGDPLVVTVSQTSTLLITQVTCAVVENPIARLASDLADLQRVIALADGTFNVTEGEAVNEIVVTLPNAGPASADLAD